MSLVCVFVMPVFTGIQQSSKRLDSGLALPWTESGVARNDAAFCYA